MAHSRITYTGNGTLDTYSVPFPFLDKTHVKVTVNGIIAIFTWPTSQQVQVIPPPANGSLVEIYRQTSPDMALFDFTEGSVLTAEQLDKANLQNFYLTQEALDKLESFTVSTINAATGGTVTQVSSNALINQITADIINSQLYNSLNTRMSELDSLALDISAGVTRDADLQTQITQLASGGGGGGVSHAEFNNAITTLTTADTALSQSITNLNASVASNSSAITNEQVARANADSAISGTLNTVSSTVNGHTTSIQSQQISISGLSAQYTVKIDNNGYVSGYGLASTQVNGAPFSSFIILADKFAIVKPGSAPGATPVIPFVVGSTTAGASTVGINGQLVIDGSIYARTIAANTITADKLLVNSLSSITANLGAITTGSVTLGKANRTFTAISGLSWVGTANISGNTFTKPTGVANWDIFAASDTGHPIIGSGVFRFTCPVSNTSTMTGLTTVHGPDQNFVYRGIFINGNDNSVSIYETGTLVAFQVAAHFPSNVYEVEYFDTLAIYRINGIEVYRTSTATPGLTLYAIADLFSVGATISNAQLGTYDSSPSWMELSDTGPYYIWAGSGGKNDTNAKFYVKRDGSVKYAGDLEAAGGTFKGALQAASGTFSGNLVAASGTFSGTLTATAIDAVDTINVRGQAISNQIFAENTSSRLLNNLNGTSWDVVQTLIGQPSIRVNSLLIFFYIRGQNNDGGPQALYRINSNFGYSKILDTSLDSNGELIADHVALASVPANVTPTITLEANSLSEPSGTHTFIVNTTSLLLMSVKA